jgi:antitoxin component YwqK of YwqJK toxin-antitoxin module
LFSQGDTILIRTFYPDQTLFQEYQSTTADSIPNGNYKSYNKYGKISSSGKYRSGEKVGIWTYYSDGSSATEIVQKYDYDTQSELFYNYSYEEIFGTPRFPGGISEFEKYVRREIIKRISREQRAKYEGKKINIIFNIDKQTGLTKDVRLLPIPQRNDFSDPEILAILTAIIGESPRWILSKNMTDKSISGFNLPLKF